MKKWVAVTLFLVLQVVVQSGCQSAQNTALNNESVFARVPVLLSKKTRLGQEGAVPVSEKAFDYHETFESGAGGNYSSREARGIGLREVKGLWISIGAQPALKPGQFVQLTGECEYRRSFMFPVFVVLDSWEFHCEARVLRDEEAMP